MKLPDNIDKITVVKARISEFPPNGFIEFEEGNDGSGDNYGLYWAIGRDLEEPIVCYKNHEEFLLVPEFPDLDSFLKRHYVGQGQTVDFISSSKKPFFPDLYNKARVLTKNNKTEDAIQVLEESVEQFAEFADAWTLLAENYYKQNQLDKAEFASLNSIISNYAFGLPSKKAIDLFNKINPAGKYKDHPLVKRKEGLLSGGSYFNPFTMNYNSILDTIAEFENLLEYRSALILEQNYSYLMSSEKMEIKEKNNFNSFKWAKDFREKLFKYYPDRAYFY
ncbi:tetratricopeptide repeat protein [Pedobacter sp. AW31-3R]|uniref:tetratricopeptide repeat protein n=1 Tax=Pedobacter sp. AW31-3R TaxID=3445781 RepID=UPI003FA00A47